MTACEPWVAGARREREEETVHKREPLSGWELRWGKTCSREQSETVPPAALPGTLRRRGWRLRTPVGSSRGGREGMVGTEADRASAGHEPELP